MKKNYTYVYEKNFSNDFSELNKLVNENDISIAFSDFLEVEGRQDLISFAESVSPRKILLLESSLGKGGFGQSISLSLIGLVTYSIFMIFSATILTELSKDIYKNSLGKLFKPNKISKYNIGNVVIEILMKEATLQYVFFDYFTADDCIEAFSKIEKHILTFDKKSLNGRFGRFAYDRKSKEWKLM
jgi:hypothetical protein